MQTASLGKKACALAMAFALAFAFAPASPLAFAEDAEEAPGFSEAAESDLGADAGTEDPSETEVDPKDLSNGYIEVEDLVFTRSVLSPKIIVRDYDGATVPAASYDLSYARAPLGSESDDSAYTAVGQVRYIGTYRVSATAKAESGYFGSVTATFRVVDPSDLENAFMQVNESGYMYTGSAIVPAFTLEDAAGNEVPSDDYTVSYEMLVSASGDEDGADAYTTVSAAIEIGDYRVVATAKAGSGYTSSATAEFRILDPDDLANASFDDDDMRFAYTGGRVVPSFVLTSLDGRVVDPGAYDVSYSRYDEDADDYVATAAVSEVGDYRVVVTARAGSGYTGSAYAPFSIVRAEDLAYASISVGSPSYVYEEGYELAPSVTVTQIGSSTPLDSSAYELSYEKRVSDGSEAEFASVTGVTGVGRYRVRAQALDGNAAGCWGQTDWAEFSVVAPIDLSTATLKTDRETYVYAGSAIVPVVTVTDSAGVEVDAGTYTVSYEKLVGEDYQSVDAIDAAGRYRVVVRAVAHGGCTGSVSASVRVVSLEEDAVTRVAEQIRNLPASVENDEDAAAVAFAKSAYDALSDAQKALVGSQLQQRLALAVAAADAYEQSKSAAQPQAQTAEATESSDEVATSAAEPAASAELPTAASAPTTTTPAKKVAVRATVNVKKVTAAAVAKALEKAGSSKTAVTTLVIGAKASGISKGAFKGLKKLKTLVVKSKKLTRKSVKGSLRGSKVTAVSVSVGKAKASKRYAKAYKQIFAKANSGKKVKVKAAK